MQLFEMHIMAMHTCQIILYGSPSPYDMDIHRIFDFDPIKVIVLCQIHLPSMDGPSVNASLKNCFVFHLNSMKIGEVVVIYVY